MRLKHIQIVVQGEEQFYDQVREAFSTVARAVRQGKKLPRAIPVLSFPSIAEIARTLTPKRLELLRLIRRYRPQSVCQLASLAERDIKNVSTDLRVLLENLGLVETQERETSRQPKRLRSTFDRLDLQVYL
jgi:predicted transcriptional regulator